MEGEGEGEVRDVGLGCMAAMVHWDFRKCVASGFLEAFTKGCVSRYVDIWRCFTVVLLACLRCGTEHLELSIAVLK